MPETTSEAIGVSLLGAGNVGGGVASALATGGGRYAERVGRPLELRRALVRDTSRPRPGLTSEQLTANVEDVLGDDATRVVVELMGGEEPARAYIESALVAGKHVVTANKEVMAKHGSELLGVAAEHGVRLLYEASVGGGIPIISPLSRDLLANEITAVTAIINGTTNFMLTAMAHDGAEYEEILAEAQRLGYAEPDPTADVEGIDAAFKIAILCGLAFGVAVQPDEVNRLGITNLTSRDFAYADELGYTIKLLATGQLVDGEVIASVQPTLIAHGEPLAKVDGVLNAVQIEGDLVGRVVFEGPGAGANPTASAVLADVLDIAGDIVAGRVASAARPLRSVRVRPPEEQDARYYVRLTVADRPGVLAGIAGALGSNEVSIASVIQFEADAAAGTAELVLTTHQANGGALQRSIDAMLDLDGSIREVSNVLPMAGTEGRNGER
jgi:homoserine dehydrogenase